MERRGIMCPGQPFAFLKAVGQECRRRGQSESQPIDRGQFSPETATPGHLRALDAFVWSATQSSNAASPAPTN